MNRIILVCASILLMNMLEISTDTSVNIGLKVGQMKRRFKN